MIADIYHPQRFLTFVNARGRKAQIRIEDDYLDGSYSAKVMEFIEDRHPSLMNATLISMDMFRSSAVRQLESPEDVKAFAAEGDE